MSQKLLLQKGPSEFVTGDYPTRLSLVTFRVTEWDLIKKGVSLVHWCLQSMVKCSSLPNRGNHRAVNNRYDRQVGTDSVGDSVI